MAGEIAVQSPLVAAAAEHSEFVVTAQRLFDPHLPCDDAQLRRVYLRLALKYHPDKWPEDHRLEATRLFQAIAEVYESILHPGGRRVERRVKTLAAAAAELGDVLELRRLLDELPSRANEEDTNAATPLMFAAKGGCVEAVELLLERGAELNARNLLGWSALVWAALSDRRPVVELLVRRGAEVDDHALVLATFVGCARSLGALLQGFRGCIGDLRTDSNGQTLLHLVCFGMCNLPRGDPERYLACADLLVRSGVPVDVKDKRGRTSLHIYVAHPHWTTHKFEECEARMAMVSNLCSHGAKVDLKNDEGDTPLSIADSRSLHRVLNVLESYHSGAAGVSRTSTASRL